jgi:hypothetical protein
LSAFCPGIDTLPHIQVSSNSAVTKVIDMTKRNQHVVPREDGWAVQGAGAKRATELFERKEDAVDRAREISKNQGTELLIHGRSGQIQSKDSHGNDKFPPRG